MGRHCRKLAEIFQIPVPGTASVADANQNNSDPDPNMLRTEIWIHKFIKNENKRYQYQKLKTWVRVVKKCQYKTHYYKVYGYRYRYSLILFKFIYNINLTKTK